MPDQEKPNRNGVSFPKLSDVRVTGVVIGNGPRISNTSPISLTPNVRLDKDGKVTILSFDLCADQQAQNSFIEEMIEKRKEAKADILDKLKG